METTELKKLVESNRLTEQQASKLKDLAAGVCCLHKSWGFGKVQALDLILGRVAIDFKSKPGHSMELGYAADSLQLLTPTHILAQKVENAGRLRSLPPLELCRIVLQSFGGQATADQFQRALCGDVIPAEDWKKWWDSAKKAMKKDPHFGVAAKKTDPYVLRDAPVSAHQELVDAFHMARGLKDKLAAAEQLLQMADEVEGIEKVVPDMVQVLTEHIGKHRDYQPALAIEAIWVRDELAKIQGLNHEAQVHQIHEILPQVRNLHVVLDEIPTHKQKKLLPIIRNLFEDWRERMFKLLRTGSGKLLSEVVDFLIAEGQEAELKNLLERAVRDQSASGDLLAWICRSRNVDRYQNLVGDLIHPRLFSAILVTLDRSHFDKGPRRKNELRELLLSDTELVADLLQLASVDETRDLSKVLLASPMFEELDKRSLMSRVIKVCPPVQELLAAGKEAKTEPLIVSWESLERRKAEYDELVTKKIPANTKDIAIARSYGDLRENFEFKAAKETQRVLSRRRAEMEMELMRARGTDFSDARTDVVGIGTVVTVTDLGDKSSHQFRILGAWDGDPDKGIISYQTKLAQALSGKKVGEEATFEMDGQSKRYRVEQIAKHKTA
jgi:transcription elongation GreA/GreB family factor